MHRTLSIFQNLTLALFLTSTLAYGSAIDDAKDGEAIDASSAAPTVAPRQELSLNAEGVLGGEDSHSDDGLTGASVEGGEGATENGAGISTTTAPQATEVTPLLHKRPRHETHHHAPIAPYNFQNLPPELEGDNADRRFKYLQDISYQNWIWSYRLGVLRYVVGGISGLTLTASKWDFFSQEIRDGLAIAAIPALYLYGGLEAATRWTAKNADTCREKAKVYIDNANLRAGRRRQDTHATLDPPSDDNV